MADGNEDEKFLVLAEPFIDSDDHVIDHIPDHRIADFGRAVAAAAFSAAAQACNEQRARERQRENDGSDIGDECVRCADAINALAKEWVTS